MKYEELKEEISQISTIAASVPEPFRQRCFEMLLERLLAPAMPAAPAPETPEAQVAAAAAPQPLAASKDTLPTPAQVRVFMQKTGVTLDQLAGVITVEDGEVHFLKEPTPGKIAKGQIQWALLLALKSAVSSNAFVVDPEDVRSIVQEKGFYDKANFAKHFKYETNAKLFKKPLEAQGEAQGLSSDGLDALGDLIRQLAASS